MEELFSIIPDEPKVIREPYNLALTKLLRANDHKILNSYVKFIGSAIKVEITLKSDVQLVDELQAMNQLENKDELDPIIAMSEAISNYGHPPEPPPVPPIRYIPF